MKALLVLGATVALIVGYSMATPIKPPLTHAEVIDTQVAELKATVAALP